MFRSRSSTVAFKIAPTPLCKSLSGAFHWKFQCCSLACSVLARLPSHLARSQDGRLEYGSR
ncbi:hypothetical protein Pcac1_g20308 [Phytophthora cactorum]|nr:hypothetical protein Pcac1_g20308 [Phytophthora cactorum]